ncbi:MAG: HPF/RaiA family ribosome-associated protein [Deltaproteobacteria bacterium]|nr:HPF/RaiA family ribosome-associated protein [Deltaproteobacteria bacterium]
MRLEIRGGELVSEIRRDRIARRLGFALSRFGVRIATVRVRLADVNGPRGGSDKSCRMEVVGDRAWRLVVEDRDADFHAAIDRAAERAGRAVSRALHPR